MRSVKGSPPVHFLRQVGIRCRTYILHGIFDAKNRLPDIIFLDLAMQGMNGWAFLDNLEHSFSKIKFPRVFILSAFTNSSDRSIAKKHPLVSGYFDKPLSRSLLDGVFMEKAKGKLI